MIVAHRPDPHPATYSSALLPVFSDLLRQHGQPGDRVLDPFAGIGHKFALLVAAAKMEPVGIEIEPGYFDLGRTHPCVMQGDSRHLPFPDGHFAVALTSPVYPNGMADSFVARDATTRHTYVHRLRSWLGADYALQDGNAAGLNPRRSPGALAQFYDVHKAVWAEVHRVLRPGGVFIVNTKNPVRLDFRRDTCAQLADAGFVEIDHIQVPARGLNHGKNADKKSPMEDITVFRRS